VPEGVESIVMDITPAPGTYGLRISSATILLGDNDTFASGSAGFASANSTTTESAGIHNIPVTISGSPGGSVAVSYRVSAGTANGGGYDFTLPDGMLTFPPGTTSLSIPISIHPDLLPEPAETIAVQLYNPTGGNLGTSTHTVTITNQSLPEALTDAASNLLASGVTLNGRTLPNGLATEVWFQYGPTSAYGSTTSPQSIGSGSTSVNVTAPLSGFPPGGYHFRLVAQNSAGTTYGINQIVSSNNADLADLTISAAELNPSFTAGVIDYAASVSNATSSITVTPTRAQADAILRVNGAVALSGSPTGTIPLAVGVTPITILVTAQDGNTTKTYTINVTRNALPFAQWQTSFFDASDHPDADPTADPDFDGIVNSLEYVLGGIPAGAGASNTSVLPTCVMTDTAMIFSFRRTKSSTQQFFTIIETTSTFGQGAWTPVANEDIEFETIDTFTELVTTTIPRVPESDRLMVRLKVESKE
ncbi:MAG: cadherin-like beta sandwich domain-containing protein, partial [Luteolibacter sp.]